MSSGDRCHAHRRVHVDPLASAAEADEEGVLERVETKVRADRTETDLCAEEVRARQEAVFDSEVERAIDLCEHADGERTRKARAGELHRVAFAIAIADERADVAAVVRRLAKLVVRARELMPRRMGPAEPDEEKALERAGYTVLLDPEITTLRRFTRAEDERRA